MGINAEVDVYEADGKSSFLFNQIMKQIIFLFFITYFLVISCSYKYEKIQNDMFTLQRSLADTNFRIDELIQKIDNLKTNEAETKKSIELLSIKNAK